MYKLYHAPSSRTRSLTIATSLSIQEKPTRVVLALLTIANIRGDNITDSSIVSDCHDSRTRVSPCTWRVELARKTEDKTRVTVFVVPRANAERNGKTAPGRISFGANAVRLLSARTITTRYQGEGMGESDVIFYKVVTRLAQLSGLGIRLLRARVNKYEREQKSRM